MTFANTFRHLATEQDAPFTAGSLVVRARARGYPVPSRIEVVCTVLARMTNLGEIVRIRRGVYVTPAVAAEHPEWTRKRRRAGG